ncbi:hypothetical protein JW935_27235 [candidate division KSB1 bacterium]|nr:hypothetical protein [candidate division KSB1 bacterium]
MKRIFVLIFWGIASCVANGQPRDVVSLNGVWDITQGCMEKVPQEFERSIIVPGLVDMAQPAFAGVGFESDLRQAFWYRRFFTLSGPAADATMLKIHKAKYGTRVYLNGQLVGDHLPNFTPVSFDVTRLLKTSGEKNELIVRVGADRNAVPDSIPDGWDFEKYKYIPGIYDNVELICTFFPRIDNVQIVPDLVEESIKVAVRLQNGSKAHELNLKYIVREKESGQNVSEGAFPAAELTAGEFHVITGEISMPGCRRWSPEEPFLYNLELSTTGDRLCTRFAMRSFTFAPESGRAVLNGKPYFMRGTNVCILRFFEDKERGYRPWDKVWVRRLHEKFKSMNWNSIRYCIGFPPELWYDIADEVGFIIQDEFPIWYLGKENWPPALKSTEIAREYREWMEERWNHPCVLIWDGQNESVTEETGKAIRAVRNMDMSNRPWDNGWALPQSETDCVESHPYLYYRGWQNEGTFRLWELKDTSGKPRLFTGQEECKNPIILNEYAWLWLNRDGTPTSLTANIYEKLLSPGASTQQLRYFYARRLAALTEFWRMHRRCAAVMHFCGLGYSRPGGGERPEAGATSDHFIELESLNFENNFLMYVRDAFEPVASMIDKWDVEYKPGEKVTVPVFVLNDLYEPWSGKVRLAVEGTAGLFVELEQDVSVAGLGRERLQFQVKIPEEMGEYQLVARLVLSEAKVVSSRRDFEVR